MDPLYPCGGGGCGHGHGRCDGRRGGRRGVMVMVMVKVLMVKLAVVKLVSYLEKYNAFFMFQTLNADILDHQSNYDYLLQTGNSLVLKSHSKELAPKLESLKTRWQKLLSSVEKRISQYETTVDQQKQYKVRKN